jgi:acyl-coenzyme A synthetase/AMP-(fatty) acid ligase
MLKNFTLENYFLAIQKYKVNLISLQPWIASIMVKEEALVRNYDFSSLVSAICSGSKTDKNMCALFSQRFSIPLIGRYGMTEAIGPFQTSFDKTLKGK